MNRFAVAGALALAFAIPSLSLADDYVGTYELSGRYSSRRNTSATVRVEAAGYQKYRVVRTGRYTSNTFKHIPAFTWTSEVGKRHGNLIVVRYSLQGSVTSGSSSAGIVAGLGSNPSDAAVLDALAEGNLIRAVYKFSADGSEVREIAYNVTRKGDQRFWRHVVTSGSKIVETFRSLTAAGRLSGAEFSAATDKYIKDWYLEYLKDGYESELAGAATAADTQMLQDNWAADRDDDPSDYVEGNEYWEDSIDDSYDSKDYYRDAQGRPIHRDDVVVYEFGFYTNLAGIGLSKVLVFDRATGELLDEGDIND